MHRRLRAGFRALSIVLQSHGDEPRCATKVYFRRTDFTFERLSGGVRIARWQPAEDPVSNACTNCRARFREAALDATLADHFPLRIAHAAFRRASRPSSPRAPLRAEAASPATQRPGQASVLPSVSARRMPRLCRAQCLRGGDSRIAEVETACRPCDGSGRFQHSLAPDS